MSRDASFLVLVDDSPRALLFDRDSRLLGEVIEDDGFIVESLLRSAEQCPPPSESMVREVGPQPPVRCFALR